MSDETVRGRAARHGLPVEVSDAPPKAGDVLTAISETEAEWAEPSGGGAVVEERRPSNGESAGGGVFHVSWPDDASGGSFTLVFKGEETDPIPWNADTDVMRQSVLDALNALPSSGGLLVFD